MPLIIDYDRNPSASIERRLESLRDSVQRAFEEIGSDTKSNASENPKAYVDLKSGQTIYGSKRFQEPLLIGKKTGYLDGKQGVYVSDLGYIHLQRGQLRCSIQ